MPNIRLIAKEFQNLDRSEVLKLLHSQWHEERLLALIILTHQFEKEDGQAKQDIVDMYLDNTEYINNWDLVDVSAHKILGRWLLTLRGKREKGKEKSRPPFSKGLARRVEGFQTPELLCNLADSSLLWERRISIVATWWFIREDWLDPTFELAEKLLHDDHDLMHKAV